MSAKKFKLLSNPQKADDHSADLNIMTNKGVTPLHAAIMGNHLDMVNYFVTDCGQEINQPVGNKSMLHLAAISQARIQKSYHFS